MNKAIISNFSKARILVVGDIMLDRYYKGLTERISSEAPVPILNVESTEDRPGGAANVAVNTAMLGATVSLLGFVGADEHANVLSDALHAHNINCDLIALKSHNTIVKLRVVSRNQQLLRLDFEKSFADLDKSLLLEKYSNKLKNADVVILSDYDKGALSDIQSLIKLANSAKVPVIVDPKGDSFEKYRGAEVITPNLKEFEMVNGKAKSEQERFEQANANCNQYNINNILLTRSEKGMSLYTKQDLPLVTSGDIPILPTVTHLPALAKEVFDVTGAGDTVVSTLACALASNASLNDACTLANHAASVVVGKVGTSFVSTTELAIALQQHKVADGGVLNQQQLVDAVKQAQQHGEKVVMTNGCFDILHAGHVSYLNEAAKLGDRLVVAVNSDSSVTKLKGQGRPVNHAQRRMSVLSGLASVDWVVEFSQDTPKSLISEVLPNVLVKGGDYTIEDIVGSEDVIANGGSVQVLDFVEGVSTSTIISKIVDKHT